ncbi:MAG: hypothetical protein JWP25_2954 [Bradyrhizobium sp.]|jgi:hypothetical protein|nr:hypothetical protein [Bradyrhizobium sp.]
MEMDSNAWGSERHAKALRAWQLALLRFAITMDNADRLALLAIAAELDAPGSRPSTRPAFKFFYTTSAELRHAIINPLPSTSNAVLQRYLSRTDDERLKRAFAAALAIDMPQARLLTVSPKSNGDLWRGLSR